MSFPAKNILKTLKILPVTGLMIFIMAFSAEAADKSSKQKTYKRPRISRGGDYGPSNTALYKGESPCKVGSGIVHEIDSKFCGFYDHKAATSQEQKEQGQ